jgi:hypothetical protein
VSRDTGRRFAADAKAQYCEYLSECGNIYKKGSGEDDSGETTK